ncbi:MAG: UvrD-helicase domain-containing protein [Spirochaetales bacterium]|nr:UvrD-helicase domain-containing protein [Spirochaetales bacterium]
MADEEKNEVQEFNYETYNPQQKDSMFIEASAGTGKTFTIQKIVRKLVENGTPLEKILIVTYTEKAVGELKDRIRSELSDLKNIKLDVDNSPIFTIHSFCQKTLGEFYFTAKQPSRLELINESEISDFIDFWIRDVFSTQEDFKELFCSAEKPALLIESIKKHFQAAVDKYYLDLNGNEIPSIVSLNTEQNIKKESPLEKFFTKYLKEIYIAWQKKKADNKKQSFNDMIRNVREAVCEPDSQLKKKLKEKYSYAIIDEFQDTNQKQWDIFSSVFLEKKDENNKNPHVLIVVGDPKQSIYAFQGADVNVYHKAINEIKAIGGKEYSLKTNRRSSVLMVEACNELFKTKGNTNFFDPASEITFNASNPWGKIKNALYNGKEAEPLLIAGSRNQFDSKTQSVISELTDEEFAKIAVNKIVDLCSFDENGKTKLQVWDKNKNAYRNLCFKDIAILSRVKTESAAIEKEMKKCGIPTSRYKDQNLFAGKECAHWIALLNAISAPDFTGIRRKFLSEVLFTQFFNISLGQVTSEEFDSPLCEERQKIILWQQIAQKRQWAKLLESIFEESEIEGNLSSLNKLSSLSKYRQIGNYIVEYLYKNEYSLEETARHLLRLSNKNEDSEEDANIVEKSTDLDCVQIMTIHASKGLEFPVVICVGGYNGRNNQGPHVYIYHNSARQSELSFVDSIGKNQKNIEEDYEFQRVFYVAYTRASSLMILPYYKPKNTTKLVDFIRNNLFELMQNPVCSKYFKQIGSAKDIENLKTNEELGEEVKEILNHNLTEQKNDSKNSVNDNSEKLRQIQLEENSLLAEKIPSMLLYKHSYSSLSHNIKETELTGETSERIDAEGEALKTASLSEYDKSENPVKMFYDKNADLDFFAEDYPRGAKLGTALHEVLEKADFMFAGKFSDSKTYAENLQITELINKCFANQSFILDENDSKKWREQTAYFLWNTLNAKLPEIAGNHQTEKLFSLAELGWDSRLAEVQFNMNPVPEQILKNYCMGFIDLIFKRKDENQNELYSIVDWKSDTFIPLDFSDEEKLKNHTDDKYSIQRVLYSYCLIKWLKIFYDESEEEIFKNHFGGIYYVYVRGCIKGTSNGIYARTWKNYSELENSFKNICSKLMVL